MADAKPTPVWSGRALQAGFDDLETMVSRFCIPPLDEAALLLAIMDIYPRASDLILGETLVPPDHGCDGETVSRRS